MHSLISSDSQPASIPRDRGTRAQRQRRGLRTSRPHRRRPIPGPRHRRSNHPPLLHDLGARATRRSLIERLRTTDATLRSHQAVTTEFGQARRPHQGVRRASMRSRSSVNELSLPLRCHDSVATGGHARFIPDTAGQLPNPSFGTLPQVSYCVEARELLIYVACTTLPVGGTQILLQDLARRSLG